MTSNHMLSVADVAARLQVRERQVLALIASGRLRALNVSARAGRPTWRISPESLADFEAAATTFQPVPRATRRKRNLDVIAFYK